LFFFGCVLHMQGDEICTQPSQSSKGNVLLWNGEVFDGLEIPCGVSDTKALLTLLDEANEEGILKILSSVEGPWSFVYYHQKDLKLYFGRDYFGRRSLVWSWDENSLMLASVCSQNATWEEVPGSGIFCLDLNKINMDLKRCVTCNLWTQITNSEVKTCEGFHTEHEIKTSMHLKYNYKCKVSSINEFDYLYTKDIDPLLRLQTACDEKKLWTICNDFICVLKRSVQKRTSAHKSLKAVRKVAVLFSGGIDCTVLALLADLFVPNNEEIDLLNVAFEQKQKTNVKQQKHNANLDNVYEVPDRITGKSSFKELQKLCPNRKWNFVEIDIKLEELQTERSKRISMLTWPKSTVLDDSIACAIWFASRGEGMIKEVKHRSEARVLLCGMGADEQLGGYSRHRGIFEKDGDWNAVREELNMEVERIASRNLGRDDRIISDHGKEARFPYLDEEVVQFLSSLPVHMKTDLRLERGVGEKILLRGAAYQLGLRAAAVAAKRAIQFGSRIAKAESRKEKGSDACGRLGENF
uniref:Asparagine synthetase domain-containing protein 1 n=2 Tax=Ciona savignyi TaxID=51511 RepID=H2ZR64_CIOSA